MNIGRYRDLLQLMYSRRVGGNDIIVNFLCEAFNDAFALFQRGEYETFLDEMEMGLDEYVGSNIGVEIIQPIKTDILLLSHFELIEDLFIERLDGQHEWMVDYFGLMMQHTKVLEKFRECSHLIDLSFEELSDASHPSEVINSIYDQESSNTIVSIFQMFFPTDEEIDPEFDENLLFFLHLLKHVLQTIDLDAD